MQGYELVILVPVDKKGDGLVDQVKKLVTNLEGKIDEVVDWGEKPLAYSIKKQTAASFFLLNLSLPPEKVVQMDRELRINENVLRHLLIRREFKPRLKSKLKKAKKNTLLS